MRCVLVRSLLAGCFLFILTCQSGGKSDPGISDDGRRASEHSNAESGKPGRDANRKTEPEKGSETGTDAGAAKEAPEAGDLNGVQSGRAGGVAEGRVAEARPADRERLSNQQNGSTAVPEKPAPGTDPATGDAADLPISPEGPAGTAGANSAPPRLPGLRAGTADDNRQFNYYLSFLSQYGKQVPHIPANIAERITVRVRDAAGLSLPNAELAFFDARGRRIETGRAGVDGEYHFYPSFYPAVPGPYRLRVSRGGAVQEKTFARRGARVVELRWGAARSVPSEVPLDILFVMDTTGSMGEEIERLKETIEIIYRNLAAVSPRPRIRFGMVLYRDREDEYVTRVVPLTERLDVFQAALSQVQADGGGDTPEDLQSALHDALRKIEWAPDGVRLGFIVTDAPPQLYRDQAFHYLRSALEARQRAIKFYSVGTGGLNIDGEYVLRQIAQLTRGRYIFLTYGDEHGNNAGGRPGSVSHHTGSNYTNERLEAVVIRFAREELSHVSKLSISPPEEYWGARPVAFESGQETLQKLFREAAGQLVNYSSFQIAKGSPTAALPVLAAAPADEAAATFFSEQLTMALSRMDVFALTERERIQAVLTEIARQGTGLYDEEQTARIGRLSGARFLVAGKLVRRPDGYSLFLKLIRVETGEILSVAEARIDGGLAPGRAGDPVALRTVSAGN